MAQGKHRDGSPLQGPRIQTWTQPVSCASGARDGRALVGRERVWRSVAEDQLQ